MSQDIPLLKLDSVSKAYIAEAGLKINVLENISFEISGGNNGIITSVLAPFGSGKSTLLKIISGIVEPSGGKIYFNGSENKKRIPLIPEEPSSFPWLSVRQNVEFGLKLADEKKYSERDLITIAGLRGYENHYPDNRSTGFRFRISLARALALNPQLILIDDSFKSMSGESREEIYRLIEDIAGNKKQNFILATTNLLEAIYLSDKIILMSKKPGKVIRQIELKRNTHPELKNHKSEIFTRLKSEIEESFESIQPLTTINYSI